MKDGEEGKRGMGKWKRQSAAEVNRERKDVGHIVGGVDSRSA